MVDNRESDILSTLPEPPLLCSRYVGNRRDLAANRPSPANSDACDAERSWKQFGQIS